MFDVVKRIKSEKSLQVVEKDLKKKRQNGEHESLLKPYIFRRMKWKKWEKFILLHKQFVFKAQPTADFSDFSTFSRRVPTLNARAG